MATIYRFIIEQKVAKSGDGRQARDTSQSKSGAAKKGRMVSIFGGDKGGVEHNRKLRAINPLLNKVTNGWWEKGMRVGRAATGLVTRNTETGKFGISGPAIAIIIAFCINQVLKLQNRERAKAERQNTQNFKQLQNGFGAIHTMYSISNNEWNGRYTYKENK